MRNIIDGIDDFVTPTNLQINDFFNEHCDVVRKKAIKILPGDRYRNFVFNPKMDSLDVTCYTVPCLSVPFKYNEVNYNVSCFATKKHSHGFFGNMPNYHKVVEREVDSKTNKLGFISLCAVLTYIILTCILTFGVTVSIAVGLGVTIPVFFISASLCICYWFLRSKYRTEINERNTNKKIESLESFILKKHMLPLTDSEKQNIKDNIF